MFLGLTLVFQQRHKLVREDDFYQSQTAETYCDPLKYKNQYHQAMLRDHRQAKDRHTAAEIWAFLMLILFSLCPTQKSSSSSIFEECHYKLDNLSGNLDSIQSQH